MIVLCFMIVGMYLCSLMQFRCSDTYTQAFLQGIPICYSDFTADLRFRMRKVWRDIAYMNPLESDNKLVTGHFWFASPLLDLKAESLTRVRNGVPPSAILLSAP